MNKFVSTLEKSKTTNSTYSCSCHSQRNVGVLRIVRVFAMVMLHVIAPVSAMGQQITIVQVNAMVLLTSTTARNALVVELDVPGTLAQIDVATARPLKVTTRRGIVTGLVMALPIVIDVARV